MFYPQALSVSPSLLPSQTKPPDDGLEKLGIVAYQCNHTENGYPNIGFHFPCPFKEMPEFQAYLQKIGFFADPTFMPLGGSLSDSIDDYFRNPFELGWDHMVKFDHDFIGREAQEKIAKDHREMVTLVWDPDDAADEKKAVKATVARYPYLDLPSNAKYPIEEIPHYQGWGEDSLGLCVENCTLSHTYSAFRFGRQNSCRKGYSFECLGTRPTRSAILGCIANGHGREAAHGHQLHQHQYPQLHSS